MATKSAVVHKTSLSAQRLLWTRRNALRAFPRNNLLTKATTFDLFKSIIKSVACILAIKSNLLVLGAGYTTINDQGCQHVTRRFESIRMLLNKPTGWPTFVQSHPSVKRRNPQLNVTTLLSSIVSCSGLFAQCIAQSSFHLDHSNPGRRAVNTSKHYVKRCLETLS